MKGFFEILSTPKFLSGVSQSFEKNLLTQLSQIDGLIPSINNLGQVDQLRATSTKVVQQILTSCFMDPIWIATIFVDVSFHILLVSSYSSKLLHSFTKNEPFSKNCAISY